MSGRLKEIKNRIGTIVEIQQMTKAMKLVAASKLRKAQTAIQQLRPYDKKLHEVLHHVMQTAEETPIAYAEEREPEHVLLVLMTSDKGLCGSFNTNLIRQTRQLLNKKYKSQYKKGNVQMVSLGKKGGDYFKKYNLDINTEHQALFNELNYENAGEVAEFVMNGFLEEQFDRVELIYAKFINAAKQDFVHEQFLPVQTDVEETGQEEDSEPSVAPDYIFEPNRAEILEDLIPLILKTYFYRATRDNFASEQGARMVAMDNATENADELLRELRLSYNRARQAAITKEISEIVGGANALENA